MFDHFQRQYSREDFPWADLERAARVSFRQVLTTFDLWNKGRQEGSQIRTTCPFHLASAKAELTIDLAREEYRCTICTKHAENIVDFVHRLLPVQRVGAEMWLLQFVPSEQEKVMREFRRLIFWLNECGKNCMASL